MTTSFVCPAPPRARPLLPLFVIPLNSFVFHGSNGGDERLAGCRSPHPMRPQRGYAHVGGIKGIRKLSPNTGHVGTADKPRGDGIHREHFVRLGPIGDGAAYEYQLQGFSTRESDRDWKEKSALCVDGLLS